MLFLDFYTQVELIAKKRDSETFKVGIRTYKTGCVGGVNLSGLKSISAGFDWDYGKVIITPEVELREIGLDEISKLRKEAEKIGWDIYEFNNLKRENKKLLDRIKELERQLGI
jgi:hypothetical protein